MYWWHFFKQSDQKCQNWSVGGFLVQPILAMPSFWKRQQLKPTTPPAYVKNKSFPNKLPGARADSCLQLQGRRGDELNQRSCFTRTPQRTPIAHTCEMSRNWELWIYKEHWKYSKRLVTWNFKLHYNAIFVSTASGALVVVPVRRRWIHPIHPIRR